MATTLRLGATGNRLLDRIPKSEWQRIVPSLELVELPLKEVLYAPDEPTDYAWFMVDGVASILMQAEGDSPQDEVEVATIGNEGFVGVHLFLGSATVPGRAIVQIPGHAVRIEAKEFQRQATRPGALRDALGRYTQAMFALIAQSSACNRLHPIEQRCARWLLLTHDRVRGDRFTLTQEFLAQMLGVRRASVSSVARRLQDEGLIEYTRGVITIRDRRGLEEESCHCYGIIRAEFARLVG